MVNFIRPIDSNAMVDFLLDKRNELVKKFGAEDAELEEKEILDSCIIPIIDCIIEKTMSFPIVKAFDGNLNIGYWEPTTGLKMKCSFCKKDSYSGNSPYCPNCGSHMGDKNDVLAKLQ